VFNYPPSDSENDESQSADKTTHQLPKESKLQLINDWASRLSLSDSLSTNLTAGEGGENGAAKPNTGTSSSSRRQSAAGSPPSSLLGFEAAFLSDILSPKVALCDKQFQLTVDDITFIGHPTLLNADRPGTGHRFARMIQRKRYSDMLDRDNHHHNQHNPQHDSNYAAGEESTWDDAGLDTFNAQPVNQQLTMFNLVFAVRPSSKNKKFHEKVDLLYRNVIARLTAALKYEQLKRGYIKRETEMILSIKEESEASLGTP
jgi:hypothetical protein